MNEELFSELGLTNGEIKVYAALLGSGKVTATPIIKESGVSRSKVYEILDRLINKGLVSRIIEGHAMHFQAINPKRLVDIIDEKEEKIIKQKKELMGIIPELERKFNSKKEPQDITVFRGYSGLKYTFNDILESLDRNDEYIVFSAIEPPKSFFNTYMKQWDLKRTKKGIRMKIIINSKMSKLITDSLKKYEYTEVRVLKQDFDTPAVFNLFGNKTAIILWSENPISIIIESSNVTDSFKTYFKFLWKMARGIKW